MRKETFLVFKADRQSEDGFLHNLLPKLNEKLLDLKDEVLGQFVEVNITTPKEIIIENNKTSVYTEWYLSQCQQSIENFDYFSARVRNLKVFPFHLCLFLITKEALKNSTFRNAFVFCADSSDLRPDVLCFPIKIDVSSIEEAQEFSKLDDHLHHSLRRSGLKCSATDINEIVDVIDNFLRKLNKNKRSWAKQQWLKRFASVIVGIIYWSSKIFKISLFITIILIISPANFRSVDPSLLHYIIAIFTFGTGIKVAVIPNAPAFQKLFTHTQLKLRKQWRYISRIVPLLGIWIIAAVQGYATLHHISWFLAGFMLSLLEQKVRGIVYELRIRLTGVELHDEHMKTMLAKNLSTPPTDSMLWDMYAERAIMDCSRTIFPIRPKVFISYTKNRKRDAELAGKFANWLEKQGIGYFWDQNPKKLSKVTAWRSALGIEINRSSHFIFIASETSVNAETCYKEVRQALGMMHINAMPSICVCIIEPEESVKAKSKYQAFVYLLQNAYRMDKNILFQIDENNLFPPNEFKKWLKKTRPKSWLEDLLNFFSLRLNS